MELDSVEILVNAENAFADHTGLELHEILPKKRLADDPGID